MLLFNVLIDEVKELEKEFSKNGHPDYFECFPWPKARKFLKIYLYRCYTLFRMRFAKFRLSGMSTSADDLWKFRTGYVENLD